MAPRRDDLYIEHLGVTKPSWNKQYGRLLVIGTEETLRSAVDVADLLGLLFILSRIPGKSHSKLITAGLGWAAAEVVLSRGIMLWVGARGADFSWIYIQKSLESNISLVQHISTTTLLWLLTRHDLNKKCKPMVTILLIAIVFKGAWFEGIVSAVKIGPWATLVVKTVIASIYGFITLHIYTGLAQVIGI